MPHRRHVPPALVVVLALLLGGLVAAPAQAATHRLLVVGDSITQGSAGDFTWRYRLWESLQKNKGSDTIEFVGDRQGLFNNVNGNQDFNLGYAEPNFDRDHHALWGRAIRDEKDSIKAELQAISPKPTTMLVMLGTNDGAWGISDWRGALDGLRLLVQRAREVVPALNVVLGEVYVTRGASAGYQAFVRDFNANLGTYAAALDDRVNGRRAVVAPTSSAFNANTMTWDGVHPNLYGESFLASGFAIALGSDALKIGKGWAGTLPTTGWPITGPAVTTANAGDGKLKLSWSTIPWGADRVFIEQRNVTADNAAGNGPNWQHLPYSLATTDKTWTAAGLVPGHQYAYRLVPSKGHEIYPGHMEGRPGAASAARAVTGVTPAKVGGLSGAFTSDVHEVKLTWGAVAGATGYEIEQTDLHHAPNDPNVLPWPVQGTTWTAGLLNTGQWYRYRIRAVNGGLKGAWSNGLEAHTKSYRMYDHYFALGDSYSAGTGATTSDTHCGRSDKAFPYVVMETVLGPSAPTMFACAWAQSTDVVETSSDAAMPDDWEGQNPRTWPALDEQSPRQITRLKGYVNRSKSLITITIGGNDTGFPVELPVCISPFVCDAFDESRLSSKIDITVKPRLVETFKRLRLAAPGADIIAVGYPYLVTSSSGNGCPPLVRLNGGERDIIRRLGHQLNVAINSAAAQAGIVGAGGEPEQKFAGHEGCSDPSVEWINTLAGSVNYTDASFHPHTAGNVGYAFAVNEARQKLAINGAFRPAP